jgi:hypothetical protein
VPLCSHMEKPSAVSYKAKRAVTLIPTAFNSRCFSKGNGDIHPPRYLFKNNSSFIHNSTKLVQISTKKGMRKYMWRVHTMSPIQQEPQTPDTGDRMNECQALRRSRTKYTDHIQFARRSRTGRKELW